MYHSSLGEKTGEPDGYHRQEDSLVLLLSSVLNESLSAGSIVQALDTYRMSRVSWLLHFRIASNSSVNEVTELNGMLDALSEDAVWRLLRSPALCEILRLDLGTEAIKLMLMRELSLDSGKRVNAWCSTGTTWLGREQPSDSILLKHVRGRLCGPTLASGIPVDMSLPLSLANPSAGLLRPACLSEEETLQAMNSIDRAVEVLASTYPLGYSIFKGLTSNLVIRDDFARPLESWGASSGIAIGRVVLVNPNAAKGLHFLAETILHEAVHVSLDCCELIAPLLNFAPNSGVPTAISPWSGNPLSPHALIHAAVVWAVLLQFWNNCICHTEYGKEEIERYNYIRRGFETMDASGLSDLIGSYVTDSAIQLMRSAQSLALLVGS